MDQNAFFMDQIAFFMDRMCLFYGLNCLHYRPNDTIYRPNCHFYRPNLHISGRFLGGPPGPECSLGPVGAGRGRSGPVGDGDAGGGVGTCVIPDRQGSSEASDVR